MSETFFIILFFGIPICIFALLLYLHKKANRMVSSAGLIFYHFEVGGSQLSISKKALNNALIWLIPILWFSILIPFFFLPVVIFPLWYIISRTKKKTVVSLSESTKSLTANLTNMQAQIADAHQHIERIVNEIQVQKSELEEKTKFSKELDTEINKKLEQYDTWKNLTEEQKKLVINAASEALARRSVLNMVIVALVTIFLNLAATIVWTLAGSPGKQDLIDLFSKLFK